MFCKTRFGVNSPPLNIQPQAEPPALEVECILAEAFALVSQRGYKITPLAKDHDKPCFVTAVRRKAERAGPLQLLGRG